MRLSVLALFLAGVTLGQIPAALAKEPGSSDRRAQREQRRHERKERREDERDEKRERRSGPPGANSGARGNSDAGAPGRSVTRQERRDKRRAELRRRWGALIGKPAVRAELALHAKRMAKLNAIARKADADGKSAVAARARRLAEKERARHRRRMESFGSPGIAPAGSAAGAAP
jgi:hypothetical protein